MALYLVRILASEACEKKSATIDARVTLGCVTPPTSPGPHNTPIAPHCTVTPPSAYQQVLHQLLAKVVVNAIKVRLRPQCANAAGKIFATIQVPAKWKRACVLAEGRGEGVEGNMPATCTKW
jgi:hypothetical protein